MQSAIMFYIVALTCVCFELVSAPVLVDSLTNWAASV